MNLKVAVFVGVMICSAAMALAQSAAVGGSARPTASAEPPTVYIGLFSVHQNGGRGHAALTAERVGDDISGLLAVNPCGGSSAGSAKHGVSAFATDAWRMSGKVIELTDQEAVIQLEAHRIRRAGQDEASAPESMTLTLKRGERKTFETLTFPPAGTCDASTSTLGALLATRHELTGISPAADAATLREPRGGSGVVRLGRSAGPGKTTRTWTGFGVNADLWLVRASPGRPDETLHVASTVAPMPTSFSFPAVVAESRAGKMSVKVEGTIESGRAADGEYRLHFTATRAVTAMTSARPVAESKPVVEGSTKTTVALPDPNEVISFELPPLRTADGVTLPDRWSIRVRLSQK
jgi:hypothetical protein